MKYLNTYTPAKHEPLIKDKRGVKRNLKASTIPRRSASQPTPASYAQRRLWFLDQLQPGSATYNLAYNLRLVGRLNAESLRLAFESLTGRHEVLRTTFEARDGEPFQMIHPPSRWSMPVVDLTKLVGEEGEAALERIAGEEARRGFDLRQGPLLRTRLVKVDETEHVLMGTMHHIIGDGWSMKVLMSELAKYYEGREEGRSVELEEMAIQYADYAVWQQEWLTEETLEGELGYWVKRLAGAPPSLELPTDRPRPATPSHRGAEVMLEIPAEIGLGLRALARQEGVTIFMALLAAFQVLLCRWSGKQKIVVGTPIAGRSRRELEGLIGFFVNTLALVTDLSDDPSFAELLAQVHETTLGAYAHQDIPFEKLVERLSPRRDMTRTPIFQVMLTAQNAASRSVQLAGLTTTLLETHTGMAKFDLSLKLLAEQNGRIRGSLEYATDLFDGQTIERMIGHLTELMRSAAEDPHQRVSRLRLLTEREQQQLVVEWNDTAAEYPDHLCVQDMFEQQVEITPDALAVIFQEQSITYRELNQKANQLAHYLRESGVGPNVVVGVCMDRSLDIVIGMLGVIKAGGAYLPLDPAHPPQRLFYMLENASVPVLLTKESLAGSLSWHNMVRIDSDWHLIDTRSDKNPSGINSNSDLAYVIYTSGSSGHPKGVQIPYNGLINLVFWHKGAFGVTPADRATQLAGISFDASVWELWPYLLTGASVHIADDYTRLSPEALRDWLIDNRITISFAPTPLAEQMVTLEWPALVHLRFLLTGGDKLHHHPASGLPFEVVNNYGPTENTVVTTSQVVTPQVGAQRPPTIGKQISNTQVYLLDQNFQVTPIGVAGEIHIAGRGLALGYCDQPCLTAESFIPNPFSNQPGSRLYRTGDLARYLADGNIEFLGRIDQQVKIRGFRVELAEIEAQVEDHKAVRQAVIITSKDGAGEERLIGYVVADKQLRISELRDYLRERLPDYMIPSAFVIMNEMPLTANGKVDRLALPKPSLEEQQEAYIAPRSLAEELIAGIWADVLGVERVGIDNNFFDLGGHSLLATQVIARIRNSFDSDLPLRVLFESPTVAALANHLQLASTTHALPPILPLPRDADLPISFAQQRLWVLHQLDPGDVSYNLPGVVAIKGPLNIPALDNSLNEILRRHEALRTRFISRDGQPLQLIDSVASLDLHLIDLSRLSEDERSAQSHALAQQEALHPFDLSSDRLLRAKLIILAERHHILLLTFHHIIFDGWSLGLLANEASHLYSAFLSGNPSPLPDLPIQYADFSSWQRQSLTGHLFDQQLDYWMSQLQGAPPALDLPTDRPRPAVESHRGALIKLQLDPRLVTDLKRLCRRQGATLYMGLLACYHILLHRHTAQLDISVGTPIAGRTRIETEPLIGLFVNTLVMRVDLSGEPTFNQLLSRVRQVTLEAYANQDLPFEQLVKQLSPDRDMSRSALFQVMFALQNAPFGGLELGEAELEILTAETRTSKFEMSMTLQEEGEAIEGWVEYNTDLFDEATIERMISHYRELMAGAAANAERRIIELALLTEGERQQLLIEWNDTSVASGEEGGVHRLFEQQVDRTPDAVAVICGDEQLTYSQLDRRANQMAHHLIKMGAGPEALVGVCLSRSAQLVVALLGILKAGAAYVPLDPTYPADRLNYMLKDSEARLVVTDKASWAKAAEASATRVGVEQAIEEDGGKGEERPSGETGGEQLAYVIYTSGSTGRPKGVMITHGALCNHMRWMLQTFPLTENDRVIQRTPFSFDASVWEFYAPLLSGATLVMHQHEKNADVAELIRIIIDKKVTTLQLVPSLLRMLLLEPEFDSCDCLKRVFCGGESLTTELQRQFHARLKADLYNLYGPTEACIDSTFAACKADYDQESVPIGRPISNAQAYVLDYHLNPVPIGVIGELYIGGDGLALGYLLRPALTADRFIPNPFSPVPGSRLYRTGDLARWLPDSNLDYVGRIDHQVKVRGFRIELGEIESALQQQPSVQQAAVIVREDGSGNRRLVAYLVLKERVSSEELREALRQRLPDYMVPSMIVELEELPLTASGKVDRLVLPEPSLEREEGGYVAPRSSVEELIAGIWADVLGVERVGVKDDFFDLGGDSLLNIQIIARARQAGIRINPSQLFQARTIEALARMCEQQADAPVLPGSPNLAGNFITGQPSVEDLRAEAILDDDIYPESAWSEERFEFNHILLTGGTGFLGAFLLDSLLRHTRADIYCLVRCDNAESGVGRIKDALESFRLWDESYKSRIIPVPGDLSQPLLGLSPDQFGLLATRIDAIYHNGALVNLTYPYAALKAVNVQGSREILRLACQIRSKPVHYVSTISVFSSVGGAGVVLEADEPVLQSSLSAGYAQSKWVAERLAISARSRGLPVSIYRPGTITGDSRTGMLNLNDFFSRLIKGCVQIGGFPDWGGEVNIIPVNCTSDSLVQLSLQKESLNKHFHLINPISIPWASFVDCLRSFGYRVERLPYIRWRRAVDQSPDNAMHPLLPTLPGDAQEGDGQAQEFSPRRNVEFDCANTLTGLANSPIVCPTADSSLIHKYLTYMVEAGFLEAPELLSKSSGPASGY